MNKTKTAATVNTTLKPDKRFRYDNAALAQEKHFFAIYFYMHGDIRLENRPRI